MLGSLLSWLCDGYWPTANKHEDLCAEHGYTPQRLFGIGDSADLYLAVDAMEAPYLLKVPRERAAQTALDHERNTLTKLLAAAAGTTYDRYLPDLVDSYLVAGRPPKRVNVFRFEAGFHTLEEVHAQYQGLDGRHLAWIFNRMLTVLGFCHRQHFIHGALLPCHVLVHAPSHGLKLIGWGQSVACVPTMPGH
jgi:hypothetical protein